MKRKVIKTVVALLLLAVVLFVVFKVGGFTTLSLTMSVKIVVLPLPMKNKKIAKNGHSSQSRKK